MRDSLYLHEEFMLLALREEKGTIAGVENIEYPLAAAVVSELLLQVQLEIDQAKPKKKLINLVGSTPFGDPILDEALDRIKNAKRRASLNKWVERLANLKKLKHRTALQLCERGILKADEDKVLRIFTRKIYPELNPEPERKVVECLRRVIFFDTQDVPARDALLVGLAHHTGLLQKKFAKEDLKPRKKHIKEIAKGNLCSQAAKDLMDAVNTAVMAAVVVVALAGD